MWDKIIEVITKVNSAVNGVVWGWPVIILILGTGLLLSVRTGFLQIRKFGDSWSSTIGQTFKSFGKKNKTYVFDEAEALIALEFPQEYDTMEVDLRKDDKTVVLEVSSAKTLKKAYNELMALGKANAVEDLSLCGIDVRLYQTSYGFSCAVWEENSRVYKATFIYDNPSLETDKTLLTDYFDNR